MWSIFTLILRLLYLKVAIKLHEQLDRIVILLSATDWAILQLLKPAMKPFVGVQKLLEGKKHVTGSRVVPHASDLREGLKRALVDIGKPAPLDSRD